MFLSAENRFVPEMYLKQPRLMYRCIVLVESSQMTKQEQNKSKEQETLDISARMK